jgi:hypothetical protein
MAENQQMEGKASHTGRRLYQVPFVLTLQDAPEGYNEKVQTFWREAMDHVRKLEARFGSVRKIYHESVPAPESDAALKALERTNSHVFSMIDKKLKLGAQWVPIEGADLLQELIDWSRCLGVVTNPKVVRQLSDFLNAANRKRNDEIAERIDHSLQDGEAGLLIIGQDHGVQFPPDIQVFYVSPPSLDEVRRLWRVATKQQKESKTETA